MGDNHIIGSSDQPRTTRSGRQATALQSINLMFTSKDVQETRETNRFIKQLRNTLFNWTKDEDPDPEVWKRDIERRSGDTTMPTSQ